MKMIKGRVVQFKFNSRHPLPWQPTVATYSRPANNNHTRVEIDAAEEEMEHGWSCGCCGEDGDYDMYSTQQFARYMNNTVYNRLQPGVLVSNQDDDWQYLVDNRKSEIGVFISFATAPDGDITIAWAESGLIKYLSDWILHDIGQVSVCESDSTPSRLPTLGPLRASISEFVVKAKAA